MRLFEYKMRLPFLLVILAMPAMILGQGGLPGTWKYSDPNGEMIMQITATTITLNNQTFPYQAQGNVLMINEGAVTTPYPYMLDGNRLTIEFPGGMEAVFTRGATGSTMQGQLPTSMSRSSAGTGQGSPSSTLSGKWIFQSQQGQLILDFLSSNQLSFNGETTQYQLRQGVIQAMGDYGWIDYPYTLSGNTLSITFPDGTNIPFNRASSAPVNQQYGYQQGMNRPQDAGGSVWQLRGALCSWSGSSNDYSSYSSTQKIVFDGQGTFQFGTESSFSGDAGMAYSGNPNVQTGTYSVGNNTVTLRFQDGSVYEVQIHMRQDNGMITELMHNGTLFATGLCE
ncbi:MAG: hypothetical protein JXR52_11335 [Bacteroidales bacterium]|nr:hypothetical protein [Bacteroidales bacterium]